jgi:hypothetical protein
LLVAAIAGVACTAQAAGTRNPLPLVACPIVQDTPSVPCWIVEAGGETYYLGIQSDVSAPFNPPALGHKVLVEGAVKKDAPRICGGLVVEPVTVSILPELSPECGQLRVADPRYTLPFEPPRPPGPSSGQLAYTYAPPPAPPAPPYLPKDFTVSYEFEGMVNFKTPRVLEPVLRYAQLVKATRIEVRGYRGATRLANGSVLAEHAGIAQARADEIAGMLRGAGVDRARYTVTADDRAALGGAENRRVTVRIIP